MPTHRRCFVKRLPFYRRARRELPAARLGRVPRAASPRSSCASTWGPQGVAASGCKDTTDWLELQRDNHTWVPKTAPTAMLKSMIAGAVVGAIVASSQQPCELSVFCSPYWGAAVGAPSGAVLGIFKGTLLGALVGHRTTVEFDDCE